VSASTWNLTNPRCSFKYHLAAPGACDACKATKQRSSGAAAVMRQLRQHTSAFLVFYVRAHSFRGPWNGRPAAAILFVAAHDLCGDGTELCSEARRTQQICITVRCVCGAPADNSMGVGPVEQSYSNVPDSTGPRQGLFQRFSKLSLFVN
jgi:hypothetical protein